MNNLPKELDCAFCDGIAKLKTKDIILYVKGIAKQSTQYYYQCDKCNESFTTTESDELTINNIK